MLCQSPFSHLSSSQDCKKLYQFLDLCRQQSIETNQAKIASVALDMESIDPLIALNKLLKPDQLHFYFENRDQGQAIAAINTTLSIQTSGSHRFIETQNFIRNSLKQIISNSPIVRSGTSPRFFCSFSFFDEQESQCHFPAATVFLPQWQVIRQQNNCIAIANLLIDSHANIEHLTQTIWQQLQTIRLARYDLWNLPNDLTHLLNSWKIIDKNQFQSAVISALKSIDRQHFHKLVIAHAIDVIAHFPFRWDHCLHNLRQLHPDCYVFSTGNGQGQSFIGASPERLLSIQNRQLITDALAGSAPRGRTANEDAKLAQRLMNSDKERHEHHVVVDFITRQLTHFGLIPQLADAPKLRQLANIQHLHTPISATLPIGIHPLELVAQLHPTPAVAGLPRTIACEQIRQYESFGRSLYAAPLGWIDAEGNAEFIVGIRSALIDQHRARLFAGAGIVAGSDPDREFAEVKLKLQALLRALV